MKPSEVQTPDSTEQVLQPALDLPADGGAPAPVVELDTAQLKAIVEAVIYITDEPLSADQIATALQQPAARVGEVLAELTADYNAPTAASPSAKSPAATKCPPSRSITKRSGLSSRI